MITVTDNKGRAYTARILHPGDSYGRGAVWATDPVCRDLGPCGITVDGAPGTWYAGSIAAGNIGAGPIALDFGQGWFLTEDSSDALRHLARAAMAATRGDRA